jgi:hypothetical protein
MRRMSILFFVIGGLGFAQHAKAQMDDAVARPTEKLLAAHVEVVNQSYCHVDDESFVASLNLRLQFVNTSGHPLILSRKLSRPLSYAQLATSNQVKGGIFCSLLKVISPLQSFPTVLHLEMHRTQSYSSCWLQGRNLKL